MARTWKLGEGITVQDLVRLSTTSVAVRNRLRAHYTLRRGMAHPVMGRVSTITLNGTTGKATRARDVFEAVLTVDYAVSDTAANATKRTVGITKSGSRIATITIANK